MWTKNFILQNDYFVSNRYLQECTSLHCIWLNWRNDVTTTSYCPVEPGHKSRLTHTKMPNIITRTAFHYWGVKCSTTTTFSISSHILIRKSFWIFATALSWRTMIDINFSTGRKWARVNKTTWKRFKFKITCFCRIKLRISKATTTTKSCY